MEPTGDGGNPTESAGKDAFTPGKSPLCEQESRECYTGKDGTQRKGPCKAGKQRCVKGEWGPCVGEVVPKDEQCNGIDDDCDGQVDSNCTQWSTSAGGKDGDQGLDIAVDAEGNIYVTGSFHGKADFGNISLHAKGETDAYLAKLNSKGEFLWAVALGGSGYDGGKAVATDSSGHVYMAGFFDGTAQIESTTLSSQGGKNVYVVKLDNQGKVVWSSTAGGRFGGIDVNDIAVDGNGNVLFVGAYAERASFGEVSLAAKKLLDAYMAKLDSQGKVVWAVSCGGAETDEAMSIALDTAGNSYVTGYFQATAQFGETLLTSGTYTNAFFAKLNAQGEVVWAKQTSQGLYVSGTGIAVDGSGNVYATGFFEEGAVFGSKTLLSSLYTDIFATKLNSQGQFQWSISASAYYASSGIGMSQDSAGNLYLVGSFSDRMAFGSATVTSRGASDAYVVKLSPSGQFVAATSVGGTSSDEGKGLAVDAKGNVFLTGTFRGSTTMGSQTLSSQGYTDLFVTQVTIK